jgi:bifunctional DNA-binding transcriptional regulator/antitoxin component of YhaV-PrlF toxin-antitoxin module
MITSKLTSKAQTTIPQPVRAALRLVEGDELAYEIDGARVILTKVSDRGARRFRHFYRMGQRRRPEGLCQALSGAKSLVKLSAKSHGLG